MVDRESIREELEELIREKEKDISSEEKERLVDETVERMRENDEKREENDIVTRRNFLKLTGLGIGGLAFSSLGASWIRNSPSGSSDLATTLSKGNSAGGYNIDMSKNQILNLSLDKRTSDPSSPVEGQIWFRTDL